MKKSKDITKYDLDWQVKRVSLKNYKTYQEKCDIAKQYLLDNQNIADKERVLNYLEGLSMAYKDKDRAYILDMKNELSELVVSNENKFNFDLSKYSLDVLKSTAKDNQTRCNNWLKKGYRNQELIDFLFKIYEYINDTKAICKLNVQIEDSKLISNSHHFFF